MPDDYSSNNGLNILEWLKNHSYAILVAIGLMVIDFHVITYKVDLNKEAVKENRQELKTHKAEFQELENVVLVQNATILQELKFIKQNLKKIEGE